MPKDPIDTRIDAVRQLLALFRMERVVYVIVTLLSLAILFYCAVRMLQQPDSDVTVIVSIFAGSGGILYTTGRLLKMWSDALHLLCNQPPAREGGDHA
jgi:hypothetical protein